MSSEGNLLIQLHRWAHHQDENFTTDSLAHLLRHLLKADPVAGTSLLSTLTYGVHIDEGAAGEVSVKTQVQTDHGIPDIWLEGPDFQVLVEVKVEAALGPHQLEDYLEELAIKDVPTTRLVLLTPYAPNLPPELRAAVQQVRWYQIADALDLIIQEGHLCASSQFLAAQFSDFLLHRGLMRCRLRSDVSAGLRAYVDRTGDDSIFNERIRSLDLLPQEPELAALHSLLEVVGTAMDSQAGLSIRSVGSGQNQGGWIGYNADRSRYFVSVDYANPEVLCFERFRDGVDPSSWDGATGRIHKSYGDWRWEGVIDLASAEVDFFAQTKVRQLEILEGFLAESLRFARTLEPSPLGDATAENP